MSPQKSTSWTLTARWIFVVEGQPLENGTITINGDRIVAVEPHGRRSADVDLGNAAVIPGLVNAHTHLDLSGLRGAGIPAGGFTDWLRAVIRHRRNLSTDQLTWDIQAGLNESVACGTTLIGDISAQGLSWPALVAAPVRAIVFFELLGLPKTRAHQAWAGACEWLRSHPATGTCRPGLSPHAPYSIRSSLFRAAANYCQHRRVAMATHLAETQAELELLERRCGPFVDFLSELGVWDPEGLANGASEILRLNADTQNALFIHGNYLDAACPFLKGATLVYCPRTHAAFGHQAHPFRTFLQAGVRVALGTDSLASNPDLNVFEEVRFLHDRFPDLPGSLLLRMATLYGAEALGWEKETGSLVPGKSADLVVLPLTDLGEADPHRLLLSSAGPVNRVLWRGEWYSRDAKVNDQRMERG
jgi:cytosine/adenosine deaminase-related metal-dependent hydrolase